MTAPPDQAPSAPAAAQPLRRSVILTYCLPTLGAGMLGMPFYIWLMKYSTDVLLIAPAAFGAIFLMARFWDAISDPIAGYLSDRTKSRLGRRRSWMLASAVPVALTTVMLWSPPWALEGFALVLWMAAALLLYETASTAFFVPYGALGMELSDQYHERTRLFGYRHVIAALGAILGVGAVYLLRTAPNPRMMALGVAITGGVVLAVTIVLAASFLRERSDYRGRGATKIFKAFADVLRNPHGRLLFIVYGIETFGAASIGMLAPYVMQYVADIPELTEVLIAAYFVPQFLFTPMWIWLGKRFSKKSLWIFSMVAQAVAYCSVFFLADTHPGLYFGVVFLLGLGGGCGQIVAPSIQADVIDYDEYLTGERKEGAYTAVWNFIRKAAAGVTAGITGFALEYSGYIPNAAEQTESVKMVLLALMGLLPGLCFGVGAFLFMRFSLNEAEHRRVVEALRVRASGAGDSLEGSTDGVPAR